MGKPKYPMVYHWEFIEKEIKNIYGIMGRLVVEDFWGTEKDFEEHYKNDSRINSNDYIIRKEKNYIYGKKRETLPWVHVHINKF